jgi:hypothetical protein
MIAVPPRRAGDGVGDVSRAWLTANGDCISSKIIGTKFSWDEFFLSDSLRSTAAGIWRRG